MKRILFILLLIPAFALGQPTQNSYIQKGQLAHFPMSEWSTQPGANLITNGTFEGSFSSGIASGWTKITAGGLAGTYTEENSVVFSGSKSQKISLSSETFAVRATNITATAGRVYQISGVIRATAAVTVRFGDYNVPTGQTYTSKTLVANQWTHFTYQVYKDAATAIQPYCGVYSSSTADIYLDDFVVREINAFSTNAATGTPFTANNVVPVAGKGGEGFRFYEFDGVQDYISLTTSTNYDPGVGDFSIICHVKMGALYGTQSFYSRYGSNDGILTRISSSGDITIEVYENSTGVRTVTANATLLANTEYVIGITADRSSATGLNIYVNGTKATYTTQEDFTAIPGAISPGATLYLGIEYDLVSYDFLGSMYEAYQFNYDISDSIASWSADMLNNTFVMPAVDRGATNVDLLSGWDFTSGWTPHGNGSAVDANTYTSGSVATGIRNSGLGLIAGMRYRLRYAGTVSAGNANVLSFSGTSYSITVSGTFDNTFTFVALDGGFRLTNTNESATTDITTFEVTRLGSTLSLSPAGMYPAIWHSYDNSVTGTVSGATLDVPGGSNLGSYYFNGTDSYLTKTGQGSLTGDVTICGWIYSLGLAENTNQFIYSNTKIYTYTNGTSIRFSRDNSTEAISASNSIKLNDWYFFVATSTSAGVTNLYIGTKTTAPILSGTANQAAGTPAAGTTWYVGNNSLGTRTFHGNIEDLTIYNRILNSAEIERIWRYNK